VKLAALEQALLADAEAEAKRAEHEAETAARERLADAEARARALVEQARLEGERLAAREGARRLGAARRRARERRLEAQRALYEEARAKAREAALALRDDPRYPELLERLRRAAIAQLGTDAELTVDPPDRGGVIARAGAVQADYTLPTLADRALDASGTELKRLWL
jgi:vacuolar-type H+-ATPase subunit E/Vma4